MYRPSGRFERMRVGVRGAAEEVVHEAASVDALKVDRPRGQGKPEAVDLPATTRLPPLLDAVVREGHETRGHDDVGHIRGGFDDGLVAPMWHGGTQPPASLLARPAWASVFRARIDGDVGATPHEMEGDGS